jgi:hypothetical protein
MDWYYDEDTGELIEAPYYDYEFLSLNLRGDLEGDITDSTGQYELRGDVNLGFGQDDVDSFAGTIITPSAALEGEVTITYVDNPNFPGDVPLGNIVPNKLTFTGSLDDRESDLFLDGDFALELKNAANYNITEDYNTSNWPALKLDFAGTFQDEENNRMSGTLSIEETAYTRIVFNVDYDLTLDGVTRQISLNARNNKDKKVGIEIASSWGPAEIDLDLTFKPTFVIVEDNSLWTGDIDDVSGTVFVQGVEVGAIKMENGVPWVFYKDGSKETL